MSIRCHKCKLFNSFSFSTNQKKCIKCNTRLDSDDIEASKLYRNKIIDKNFSNSNNSWSNTEDTYIITSTNIK